MFPRPFARRGAPTPPDLDTPPPRARGALRVLLTAAVGLTGALAPVALAAPASAAVVPDENCISALECVRIAPGWHSTTTLDQTEVLTIEPVTSGDNGSSPVPWQGTFSLRKVNDGGTQCLDVDEAGISPFWGGEIVWDDCDNSAYQRWYAEPVASSIVTDPASADRWNPWQTAEDSWGNEANAGAAGKAGAFVLRSAGKSWKQADYCARVGDSNGRIDSGHLAPCVFKADGSLSDQQQTMHLYDGPIGTWRKSAAQKDAITTYLTGAMVQHGMEQCRADKTFCSVQLRDANNGGSLLTEPSRIDDVRITRAPVPVVDGSSCASTGSMQRVYNAGDDPMEASLTAGSESSFESSVTHGFEVSATVGVEAFVNASVTVTTSHEWGKTWSESTNVSQSVNWTVPPRRYATAVVSTSAISATSAWRFGLSSPHAMTYHRAWSTDEIVDMSVPFADDPSASGPDSTLAVYNTVDMKSCSAKSPSVLTDDADLALVNSTTPGASPQVGDALTVQVDPADFRTSGTNPSPVNLAYRWYRVRAGESPQLIQRANSSTYTVTSDDVAGDEDETETMGRFRLYATVADVADRHRFDSLEYATLRTAAVVTEREDDQVGPTVLTHRVLNPHVNAGDPLKVEFEVTAARETARATGQVVVRVDGVEQAPVDVVDGTALFSQVLPAGRHQLDATFVPDGSSVEHSGARTEPFEVEVVGRTSRTTLTASATEVGRGTPVTFTATVAGTGTGAPLPTGEVEFSSGNRSLGNPVSVDADGKATLTVTLPRGEHQVSAVYTGDDRYLTSTSSARTVTVNPAATVAVLTPASTEVKAGSALPLKALVTIGTGTDPVGDGTVQLFVDGRRSGDAVPVNVLGAAEWRTDGLALGTHQLVLRYEPVSGTADVLASTSDTVEVEVVRSATTTTLTSSATSTTPKGELRFTSDVRNEAGDPVSSGQVQLYVDGQPLGAPMTPDTAGKVALSTTLTAGARVVTARYTPGVTGLEASVSAPVTVQVQQVGTAVSLVSAKPVVGGGKPVPLSAQVTGEDGSHPTGGTLQLYVDGTATGAPMALDVAGSVRWSQRGLLVGNRELSVRYTPAGDDRIAPAASPVLVQGVRTWASKVTLKVKGKKKVTKKARLVLTGKLKTTGKARAPRKAVAGRTVQVVDARGKVLGTVRTTRTGTWQLTVKGKKLAKGRSGIRATYAGTSTPSVAPSSSRKVTVTRR